MLNFRDRLPPDKVEYIAKAIIPACTKISNLILRQVELLDIKSAMVSTSI